MKTGSRTQIKGFTLIELSIALMLGMMTGAMVLALFNNQIAFLKIYRTQNFLTEEAPVINTYVSKLIGEADRFRLHNTVQDALSGARPQMASSPVLVMNFRQPDGSMRASMLSFENRGSGPQLYYYIVPVSGVLDAPQWSISNKPQNVQFFIEQGVLRMKLTGPAGEEITYSGTMQL